MNNDTPPKKSSIDEKIPKKTRRKKPRIWRVLRPFVYLFIVLCIFLVWLLGTHSGLNTALFRLPALAGIHISAQESKGTFWRGFSLKNLQIQSKGADIQMSRLLFDWDSSRLFRGQLYVQHIDLGSIHIQTKKTPPSKNQQPRLPRDIGLPLDVAIKQITLDRLTIDKQTLIQALNLDYSFYDTKHTMHIQHLNTAWGSGKGSLDLINAYPFAISGNMAVQGVVQEHHIKSKIDISGSLKNPLLQAKLHSQKMFLEADIQVAPFAQSVVEKIQNIQIKAGNFNPQILHSSAPKAILALDAKIKPDKKQQYLQGVLILSNNQALALDQGGLPFHTLNGEMTVDTDGNITLENTQINFTEKGKIIFSGTIEPGKQHMQLQAALKKLSLADLLSKQDKTPINGTIHVNGRFAEPEAKWQLKRGILSTKGNAHISQDKKNNATLYIQEALFQDQQGGELTANGMLALFDKNTLKLAVQSKKFNPASIDSIAPEGKITGHLSLEGHLQNTPDINANIHIDNSTLSSVALSAKGRTRFHQQHLSKTDILITLGENRIQAKGSLGRQQDRLNLAINAPTLAQFGFGLTGSITANGYMAGDFQKLDAHLQGKVRQFAVRDILKMDLLNFDILASPDLRRPLRIDVQGQNLYLSGNHIERIQLNAQGSLQQHQLRADTMMNIQEKPFQAAFRANGGLNKNQQWTGNISRLDVGGAINILLENPVTLKASSKAVQMGTANWQILGGKLHLESFQWQQKTGIRTTGQAKNIDLNQLEKIWPMPIKHNVLLDADWQISYDDNARGYLNILRTSGDITLPDQKNTLGLQELNFQSRLSSGKINNTLLIKTHFANAKAALNIAQQFGEDIMQARIDGNVALNSKDLSKLKPFLPIGLEIAGNIESDIRIAGRVSAPELNGPLNAENLLYYDKNTGVRLDNGILHSNFNGKKWDIESLLFKNDTGSLNISGYVAYPNNIPDVTMDVVLNQYSVLNRPDQQVILSGKTDIQYAVEKGLTLMGNLKLDKALFDFPKAGMPSLSDDVVVVGRKKEDKSQAMPLNIQLLLDLNDAFQFSGKGLDVLMGGQLNLQAKPKEEMRLLGTVNVISGRYQAYGQDLEIEKGTIAFTGEVANPTLNIRAKRRKSQVGVGVDVTGTVNHPRANIFANEPMSDKDKLSWLVLGRASSGESDNAALAAAAGTWLAGGVNDHIGLVDDIGLASRQTRNAATGEMNPAEQMVTVGKHLTNRIYLGYEYGLSSTSQAVKIMYQLSKSIQTIGRVGSESGGAEIRYSKRFD